MHYSSTCPICGGLPVDGSMSDEAFNEFLSACRNDLTVKQADFQKLIAGAGRWYYDMAEMSLALGKMRFGMTPIGTYSPEYQSWLWAWANEDFPEVARTASRQIQGLYAVTGFRVFIEEGIGASTVDAQDFAALAVHQLGAIAFYRCPAEVAEPMLYLAVHERLQEEA
jgi:Family of unknown function (DUF6882)